MAATNINKYLATVFVTASKHSRDVFAKGARSEAKANFDTILE